MGSSNKAAAQAWVYLVWTPNHGGPRGALYCGATTDLTRRMRQHRAGKGAKYLRGKPMELVYAEAHPTWSQALKREAEIKRWPTNKKRALAMPGHS